jgi:hypothetical protein
MSNTINSNIIRVGNFTSSEIVALTSKGKEKGSFGKPALTYIEECNMERRLLRSVTDDVSARPLSWGLLVENIAFEKLGMEYTLTSQETDIHPTINYWSGSRDGMKHDEGKTVIDIKSPMTLKSFCTLVDCIELVEVDGVWVQDGTKSIANVRENHKDGEKFYWQLVSNAVINDCKFAELIVYMPYLKELDEIRELAQNMPQEYLYKFFWIANGNDEELPHLLENGHYKNINIIRFEVPQSDKDFLTERVLEAGKLLQPFYVA